MDSGRQTPGTSTSATWPTPAGITHLKAGAVAGQRRWVGLALRRAAPLPDTLHRQARTDHRTLQPPECDERCRPHACTPLSSTDDPARPLRAPRCLREGRAVAVGVGEPVLLASPRPRASPTHSRRRRRTPRSSSGPRSRTRTGVRWAGRQ
jgi:hypothetical protein